MNDPQAEALIWLDIEKTAPGQNKLPETAFKPYSINFFIPERGLHFLWQLNMIELIKDVFVFSHSSSFPKQRNVEMNFLYVYACTRTNCVAAETSDQGYS